jgi:hypothetical protein
MAYLPKDNHLNGNGGQIDTKVNIVTIDDENIDSTKITGRVEFYLGTKEYEEFDALYKKMFDTKKGDDE